MRPWINSLVEQPNIGVQTATLKLLRLLLCNFRPTEPSDPVVNEAQNVSVTMSEYLLCYSECTRPVISLVYR